MKNGNITNQLKMQEQQISNESKINTDIEIDLFTDKQNNCRSSLCPVNQEYNSLNRSYWGVPDLNLSSELDLLTLNLDNSNEEQSIKRLKKKRRRGRKI